MIGMQAPQMPTMQQVPMEPVAGFPGAMQGASVASAQAGMVMQQ